MVIVNNIQQEEFRKKPRLFATGTEKKSVEYHFEYTYRLTALKEPVGCLIRIQTIFGFFDDENRKNYN